jgi:integrase
MLKRRENVLFCNVTDEWFEGLLNQKRSTRLKYKQIITNHIKPAFGARYVNEIDEAAINTFLAEKLEVLSASYVKIIQVIFISIMEYAADSGYCDPLRHTIRRISVPRKDIKVLSNEEIAKLECGIESDPSLTSLGISIALYTGMRLSEICALKWSEVDIDECVIHVRHTVVRVENKDPDPPHNTCLMLDSPKTPTSSRDIPITSKLLPVLSHAKEKAASVFVISEKTNFVPPRTFEYHFREKLREYGVKDVNFHCLRHTFATRCIELNVDVKSLSEILGHADVSITLRTYVHSSFDFKREQLEKLSQSKTPVKNL